MSRAYIVACMAIRLMGTHEIGVLLGGISRQRVDQLTRRPHFPAPVAELGQGRVWLAEDVERWAAAREERLGL